MHTNITISMVEFDAAMWDAFAGANIGPNGELPRTNAGHVEVFLDSKLAIVLADADGISVMDADADTQWILLVPNNNIALAVFIAERLGATVHGHVEIESAALKALGFTEA